MRTTLRPPRVAVVFDADGTWRSHASRALYACSRIWGGKGFILVPHHDGDVHRALRRMVAAYDPDYVVVLPTTHAEVAVSRGSVPGGMDATTLSQRSLEVRNKAARAARRLLADDCSPHRLRRSSPFDPALRDHEPTTSLRATSTGALLDVDQLRAKDDVDPAGVPIGVGGSWALSAAMRLGLRHPPRLPFEASFDTEADQDLALRQTVSAALRYEDDPMPFSFPDHPGWGSAWAASTTGLIRVDSWNVRDKPHLVVMGDTPDDFALALGWDRMFGRARWMPDSSIPSGVLAEAMSQLNQDLRWVHPDDGDRKILVASTSVTHSDLEAVAAWIRPGPPSGTDGDTEQGEQRDGQGAGPFDSAEADLHDSFDDLVDHEGEEDEEDEAGLSVDTSAPNALDWGAPGQLVVRDHWELPIALPAEITEAGDLALLVDLPPTMPDPSILSTVDEPLRWQVELRIPHQSPRARRLNPNVLQEKRGFPELVRASRDGLTGFSRSFGFISGAEAQAHQLARPRIRIPGLKNWVETMAADQRLTAAFSGPGHRIEILRRIWGTREALARDWAGPLRTIFLAFGKKGSGTTDVYSNGEGVYLANLGGLLSFNGMARLLDLDPAETSPRLRDLRDDIDRLTELGVLTRGLILNCDECATVAFSGLDALRAINTCGRCGAANALASARWRGPTSPFTTEPAFFYDLHPAARELLREDTGVALLLSSHLVAKSHSYADLSEMEFFEEERRVAEVDLIACRDDRVIIAEAKTTPDLGTKAEREDKASKLARVAHALKADEVVLCTISDKQWKQSDVRAVDRALNDMFSTSAWVPVVRTITGLGTPDPVDSAAQPRSSFD